VFHACEVAHHTSDELADGPVDEVVLKTDFESDFQILDAGFMAEAELQELVDFTTTKPGESRKFVDHDNIKSSIFDISTETLVLITTSSFATADDVCVGVDLWLVVCVLSELSKLV
jgi:hypothetical protein